MSVSARPSRRAWCCVSYLLRRRIDFALVAAPASMTLQWQDELRAKFGLSFKVVDREFVAAMRRQHGFGVNLWRTGVGLHRLAQPADRRELCRRPARCAQRRPLALSADPRRGAPRRAVGRLALRHRQPVHHRHP
ncbi:MAG: hypothetical protein WDN31_00770 [Hyphomicrobium sp.]